MAPRTVRFTLWPFRGKACQALDRSKSSHRETHTSLPSALDHSQPDPAALSTEAASDFPGLKESFSDVVIIQLRPVDCCSNTSAFDLAKLFSYTTSCTEGSQGDCEQERSLSFSPAQEGRATGAGSSAKTKRES